jgi:hypothetical protein
MHRILKICGYGLLSVLSFDFLVAIADWSARWGWVNELHKAHPHLALFVRTPWFMGVLLILGFAFLWAERKLGLPRLGVRLMNSCLIPKLRTVTLKQTFDAESKTPGWDLHKNNWDWFLEITVVNESDTPTTVDDVEIVVRVVRKFIGCRIPSWWPGGRMMEAKHTEDFGRHVLTKKGIESFAEFDNKIPGLLEKIKGVALTKGIGYRGWIHVELPRATQRDLQQCEIDVWLIDALEGKHPLVHKKEREKKWDTTLSIVEGNP